MGYFLTSLPKFTFERIVNAKKETVCDIFSNYENYEKILSQYFPSIRVRSSRENTSVVEEHVNLGDKELVIMAKHVNDCPSLHEIFVIGGDVKGSHIKEEFLDIPQGTQIVINVDLKFGGKLKMSNMFRKNKLEEDYSKMVDEFAKIAEN